MSTLPIPQTSPISHLLSLPNTSASSLQLYVTRSWSFIYLPRYLEPNFPGSSNSEESACNEGDPNLIPGFGRFPWRREWWPTPVFLPGKSYRQRSLDMTEWLTLSQSPQWIHSFLFKKLSYCLCDHSSFLNIAWDFKWQQFSRLPPGERGAGSQKHELLDLGYTKSLNYLLLSSGSG